MEQVLARLSRQGEQFLDGREEDSAVEIREDEVVLAWYDEFHRMIYNEVQPNDRVEIGILLTDEKPTGATDFLHEQLKYTHPETASSMWSFCYETANQYSSEDLETYQAGTFL